MKKLDWFHYFLIGVVLVLIFYTWISPYHYERWVGGQLVRVNRFTGSTERLTVTGWQPMVQAVADIFKELTAEEKNKSDQKNTK